jgi:hypothetical protein
MDERIAARIERQLGMPGLLDALSDGLSAGDLQSLLLAVFQKRSRSVRESGIMAQADRPVMRPSTVDARALQAFDRACFRAAPEFEAVELSPVCPFGSTAVLGGIDSNSVMTTTRAGELQAIRPRAWRSKPLAAARV